MPERSWLTINVDRFPEFVSDSTKSINENILQIIWFTALKWSRNSDTLSYSISGTDASIFQV